jgi:hypothetical protein
MDTSKEYIKMSEKATEIQEAWKMTEGDFIKVSGLGGIKMVFLPRQDQLQEMFDGAYEFCRNDLGQYQYDDVNIDCDNWYSTGMQSSAEIALLMAIMYKKYDKSWNGEEWVEDI